MSVFTGCGDSPMPFSVARTASVADSVVLRRCAQLMRPTVRGMRILFKSNPLWGHVTPMLPLARALHDAGADVVWATAEPAAQRLRDAGIPARAAGSPDRLIPTVLARHPEIAALPPRERPDHLFAKVFGPERCGPILTDLLPLMAEVRPHLVVGDITELAAPIVAAPIAAALHRVPCVTHSLGAVPPHPAGARRRGGHSAVGGARARTPTVQRHLR